MTIKDLSPKEFDAYYGRYIYKVPEHLSLEQSFQQGKSVLIEFFSSIPVEKHTYKYGFEKWTIKEVLQHLIDTERIFMYRCFRIARRDQTPLSGFDQSLYVKPSLANTKSMQELLAEFEAIRNSSVSLIQSLDDKDLKAIGNSNGSPMSARAAAFVITGHEIWHMEIIKERYL